MKPTFRAGNYRPDPDRDLREEIEAHIEMEAEALMAGGMSEAEARQEARRLFGDRSRFQNEARREASARERKVRWMDRFDAFFRRYGLWLILFGRFFDSTRQLDGLVAGSARMPWPRFALADVAGSALWVLAWVVALDALDQNAAPLHRLLAAINPWVAGTVLVVLTSTLLWLLRRSAPRHSS